ncbi:MAG: hypothetical protein J6X00_02785 [Clostridia bacterium]|nr:hypothetical protein [Clostridia bacterium]
MAKNTNIYKFEIMEHIICAREFTTKEEVVELAKKMSEIAQANPEYSDEIKQAFQDAYREIDEELTLGNLQEIKKIIESQNNEE